MGSQITNLTSWVRKHKCDFISGGLVFLIALPLCLGISLASGYPAIAGIITAGIGGILTAVLSDSPLTIKGPAAGLIVIVLGCVTEFGYTQGANPTADFMAYRKALAVSVAAGAIQIILGAVRMGFLAELFPFAVIHGMLAAIGCIIIFKQVPVALGLNLSGSPLELVVKTVQHFTQLNPEIAVIGFLSLVIMVFCARTKIKWLKRIPSQMLVLLAMVPLARYFNLGTEHTYSWGGHLYALTPKFLVNLPKNILGAVVLPDFSALKNPACMKWIALLSVIGTLESLVSVQAVDLLDPLKRKTNRDRDLLAIGVANTVVAFIGGLPMISEIVRSRANIDNGAKSSVSNGFHGFCLLFFVALFPALLHRIPLAALAAMLIFTGYRLASMAQFKAVFETGIDQFIVFVVTLVTTLATDLLVGLGVGIVAKIVIHVLRGVPLSHLFKAQVEIQHFDHNNTTHVKAQSALVFLNWLSLKKQLESISEDRKILVDVSYCPLIDHSVMERIHELKNELNHSDRQLEIQGLDDMIPTSLHPFSSRRRIIPMRKNVPES